MKTGLLKNYIRERLKSIERDLKTYEGDNKSRHLHHLRVEIKKIKAVFYFAGKINKGKYYQDELKPLFQDAGEIRELQIHIQQFGALPHLPEKFSIQLVNKKKKCQELFRKNIPRYLESIRSFRKKFYLPPGIPGKTSVINYLKKETTKSKLEMDGEKRESLHRFRKRLKKIMYVYDILPGKLQSSFELNTGYINKLQEKIGKWHDSRSAIYFLSHWHISVKMHDYISALKEKEKKQFRSLIKKIKYDRIFGH